MAKITIDTSVCFECGAPSEHQHHIIPQVYGGNKTIPLCRKCHGRAHCDMSWGALSKAGQEKGKKEPRISKTQVPFEMMLSECQTKLSPHPENYAIALEIYRMWKRGWGDKAIRTALNKAGHKRNGKRWNRYQVRGMIRRWRRNGTRLK